MSRCILVALLTLLPSERGENIPPIKSGYRSLARFEGAPIDYGFELQLEGDSLGSGSTSIGRLSFWAANELPALTRGVRFEIREGSKVIGHLGSISA